MTDETKHSIPLDKILSGGPGKDGIPALVNPKFVSVADAPVSITDTTQGILVSLGGESKFYPYNILVWHEIVNDSVGGTPVAVTFCPLCGSAIVFDPIVNGARLEFGVSGKLYESNLLMYDRTTDSLWSQALGEAVVGEMTGTVLAHVPFQLLTFAEVKASHPSARVQSDDTGHYRSYSHYPYGDYDSNDSLIFPVSVSDSRFHPKEIMYVVRVGESSVAFPLKKLKQVGGAKQPVSGTTVTATVEGSEVTVTDALGEVIPGYYEMWFSFATHHQEDGVVWSGK